MKKVVIFIILTLLTLGCSVKAIKYITEEGHEIMELKGMNARKATFENGSSIEKDTTIKIPNIYKE